MLSRFASISIAAALAIVTAGATAGPLPKEVQRDMHVLGLGKALKAENYAEARKHIEVLNALGVDLPPPVLYFSGETYYQTCDAAKAKDAVDRYLTATGNKGRYYKKSLELLMTLEAGTPSTYCPTYRKAHRKDAFNNAFRHFKDYLNSETFNWDTNVHCEGADWDGLANKSVHYRADVSQHYKLTTWSESACKISLKYEFVNSWIDVEGKKKVKKTVSRTNNVHWDLLREKNNSYGVIGKTRKGVDWWFGYSSTRDNRCGDTRNTNLRFDGPHIENEDVRWMTAYGSVGPRKYHFLYLTAKGAADVDRLKASLKAMAAACSLDN